MGYRNDIDKQLAELEALARGEPALPANEPSARPKKRKIPRWVPLLGLAIVIDIAARFFVPTSDSFVRILEAFLFGGAAVALITPILRKASLTKVRRKVRSWLAAVLALGAIRSGMWGLGVPVEYANLTIFLIGLVGLVVLFLVRKRKSPPTED